MQCKHNFRVSVMRSGRLCPPPLSAYGQAYRYALYKLNPFAVTGSSALYDGINAHGELNRYNPATGSGSLTDQYLKDRAAMLAWKLKFGTNDTAPVGDTFVQPQDGTPFYFEDFTSNAISTKMRIGGGDSVNAGADNDIVILRGGAGDDHLYGEEGDDIIDGGAGVFGWFRKSSRLNGYINQRAMAAYN